MTLRNSSNVVPGHLKVLVGKMFDGKTEWLLTEAKIREKYVEQRIFYFKPRLDNRDVGDTICSHNGRSRPVIIIDQPSEIFNPIEVPVPKEGGLVLIDEMQFFDLGIIAAVNELLNMGYDVIAAGLATDFLGRPFGATLLMTGYTYDVVFLDSARCTYKNSDGKVCGERAIFNQKFSGGQPVIKIEGPGVIDIGAKEKYAPRCRAHWVQPENPWAWTEDPTMLFEKHLTAVAVR